MFHKIMRVSLTYWGLNKVVASLQMMISTIFSWIKNLYFDSNFNEICSQGSNWHYVTIDLGNSFALIRQQVITWTNSDEVLWCHMISLGHNELNLGLSSSIYGLQRPTHPWPINSPGVVSGRHCTSMATNWGFVNVQDRTALQRHWVHRQREINPIFMQWKYCDMEALST